MAGILTGVFPGGKDGDSLPGRELLDVAEADPFQPCTELLGRDPDRSLGATREGEDRPSARRGHPAQLLEERDHVLEDDEVELAGRKRETRAVGDLERDASRQLAREQAPRLLILLAERDPYAAEFAEFFLQTEGYEVALALDADDAARKFEQLLPQLAVIELLISGGTGAHLCQRLKEAGVPACLVISTLDARDQALAAGADAFLRKPLDPLQFVSTVKDLLGKSAFLQGVTSP